MEAHGDLIRLFLCGDVMIGRGIDQILSHPSGPRIFERCMVSALDYVKLAERVNGPIPRPVGASYIWGDAIGVVQQMRPDARIVNLETSITACDDCTLKGINYRTHPANIDCLAALGVECCALANNHVLDWGAQGLLDTLDVLERAGVRVAGAGRDQRAASAPAILPLACGRRIVVCAFGLASSGIPPDWAAGPAGPGVNLLSDASPRTIETIAREMRQVRRPGDLVVASIHWGGNWGHDVPGEQVELAHALIDHAGVDLIHGHSSHHAKAIEVHGGKLILYGCGDFINDYEGISGHEQFRTDLALAYFPVVDEGGRLHQLIVAPFRIKQFRLNRACESDTEWLCRTLSTASAQFGCRLDSAGNGLLNLAWQRIRSA